MSDGQKEIARIELNATDRLVITTNEYRGKEYVDIRKFVETPDYTGPTKQGVRFSADLLPEVLEGLEAVASEVGIGQEE